MRPGASGFPALRPNEYRDAWCGQVLPDRVGRTVRVAGWVHRRRDHGGLVFIDLRDRTGLVQLVFNPDTAGGAFELGHKLRSEDVLTASGEVVRRSPETVNPDLPTGEVEIRINDADLLAYAESGCARRSSFATESFARSESSSTARGSSTSRRRCSRAPRRRGRATSWCRLGAIRARSTRCRSRRSCSSSS